MERRDAFEFYVDYLLSSPRMATATGLSAVLDNTMKHDYISDCLAQNELDSKAFWSEVKPFVRQIEHANAYVSIDDVIVAKPHSTENELICYHYDHTKGKAVKGINILNFMLSGAADNKLVNCPLAWQAIRKTEAYIDKTGKQKRRSTKTKNEMVLEHLHRIVFLNQVQFKYILFDSWFSASETLKYIHHKLQKAFVCPLKYNRLVALSEQDKQQGRFIHVSQVPLESQEVRQVWIKGVDFPVQLTRQVFINKDRSEAELWLVTNDKSLNYDQITTIYQKRWKRGRPAVEEMHKSLKQNALLGKSPTKMERTQCNHIFATMLAFVKLERLKVKEQLNHFALKAKLQLKMAQAAFEELRSWKTA
jgi:hypothetical protein